MPMSIEAIENTILYRDAMMLVINKPAGVAVHRGKGAAENLERHFSALQFGLPHPPALAHRLDKDTSGCLVLGRHRQALARLGSLFSHGKIEKTYWAVVGGEPEHSEGQIALPLAKQSQRADQWHMKVDPAGQPAITDYRVLAVSAGRAWLELKPRTGRTHQLRVHCAAMGWPILGDHIYGERNPEEKLCLHAQAICIPLYPKKPSITVEAPLPHTMQKRLFEAGWIT